MLGLRADSITHPSQPQFPVRIHIYVVIYSGLVTRLRSAALVRRARSTACHSSWWPDEQELIDSVTGTPGSLMSPQVDRCQHKCGLPTNWPKVRGRRLSSVHHLGANCLLSRTVISKASVAKAGPQGCSKPIQDTVPGYSCCRFCVFSLLSGVHY